MLYDCFRCPNVVMSSQSIVLTVDSAWCRLRSVSTWDDAGSHGKAANSLYLGATNTQVSHCTFGIFSKRGLAFYGWTKSYDKEHLL